MNPYFKYLPWDTDFLGFEVGEFRRGIQDLASFRLHLESIPNNIDLVYMLTHPKFEKVPDKHELFLINRTSTKVSFSRRIYKKEKDTDDSLISVFNGLIATPELHALAIRSGRYSRFNQDIYIPHNKFEQLYRLWIDNSVAGIIADAVLVAIIKGITVGMISLRVSDKTTIIGLLSVAESYSRQGIASKLLIAANNWAGEKGCDIITVVTQEENHGAMKLYKNTGFQVDYIEPFFHLWRIHR